MIVALGLEGLGLNSNNDAAEPKHSILSRLILPFRDHHCFAMEQQPGGRHTSGSQSIGSSAYVLSSSQPQSRKASDPAAATSRYLLLPVSRPPHDTQYICSASIEKALSLLNDTEPRSPQSKHASGKLLRSTRSPTLSLSGMDILGNIPTMGSSNASGSLTKRGRPESIQVLHASSSRKDIFSPDTPSQPAWVTEHFGNFEIVEDSMELSGFQLYAVEKWCVSADPLLWLYSRVIDKGSATDEVRHDHCGVHRG